MKELIQHQIMDVSGGFRLNIGHAVAAIVTGIITAGSIGFGYAIGTIIIAQGVNNLDEMYQNEKNHARD